MPIHALNRFFVKLPIFSIPFLLIGCGVETHDDRNSADNMESKSVMKPMDFNSALASKKENSDLVFLTSLPTWTINADVLCLDAFGSGRNYSMSGMTLSNSSATLFLPSNASGCTLTINTLNNGTSTYSATGTKSAFAINPSTQVMSANVTSQKYQDPGSNVIYINGAGAGGTATIDFSSDAITAVTATNSTFVTNLSFSVNQVVADTAPVFTLYTLQTGASTYTDTLSADIAFPSNCKIINSTKSGFLTPTSWSNVNTDYGLTGSGVTSCSTVTLGSQGNWDSLKADDQYIIIATPATDGSINAYTVTKILAPAH